MENLSYIFPIKSKKATDIKRNSTDFEVITVGIGMNYEDHSWFPVSSLCLQCLVQMFWKNSP